MAGRVSNSTEKNGDIILTDAPGRYKSPLRNRASQEMLKAIGYRVNILSNTHKEISGIKQRYCIN